MKGIKTLAEHFIRGSRFTINPGGNAKEFTIGIAEEASDLEIEDFKECFLMNKSWFKTLRIGF